MEKEEMELRKKELIGYKVSLSKQMDRIAYAFNNIWLAGRMPSVYILWAIKSTIITLESMLSPYLTKEYEKDKKKLIEKIDSIDLRIQKTERPVYIEQCQAWFRLLIEVMAKKGLLLEEAITEEI